MSGGLDSRTVLAAARKAGLSLVRKWCVDNASRLPQMQRDEQYAIQTSLL